MKLGTLKLLIMLCLGLPFGAFSQDLTGIWRGFFITEGGDQYRLEFQVQQNKSKIVTGVSYSYLDTRFYGKATMTGSFVPKNKYFAIQELRTVEVRNMGGGSTCLMNYKFSYVRSGKEEFLEGTYVGKSEDRRNPANNGTWGDCGGGTVQLRRVISSDFYVEPFLKEKLTARKDTVARVQPRTTRKPPAKTPAKATVKNPPSSSRPKPPATTQVRKQPARTTPPKDSTAVRRPATPIITEPRPEKPRISAPVVTRSRKNELAQAITVNSEEITIRLYDNGEIDNDTISVYLDGELVIANKRLSASPITYTIKLNEDYPEHTLVMVAENLGRIPPNTSLMIVQDGDRRFQVSITSTEQKNAMVRFRYQKP